MDFMDFMDFMGYEEGLFLKEKPIHICTHNYMCTLKTHPHIYIYV